MSGRTKKKPTEMVEDELLVDLNLALEDGEESSESTLPSEPVSPDLRRTGLSILDDSSPMGVARLAVGTTEFDGLTSTPTTNRQTTNNNFMKNILDTKKLQNAIEILKSELNQRDLLVQNQKFEYEEKIEDLKEKLAEVNYQRQILETKLDSQINVERSLANKSQEEVRDQLRHIIDRQKQLEDVNQRLISKSNEIRHQLENRILPSDDEYKQMKSSSLFSDQIPLKDFVMIRFYELVRPLEIEIENLRRGQHLLENRISSNGEDLEQSHKTIEDERRKNHLLHVQLQKLNTELNETRNIAEQLDFKKQNYDRVKLERDQFEKRILEMDRQIIQDQIHSQTSNKEKDNLVQQLAELRQETVILRQDKEYLSRQFNDIQQKYFSSEEKQSRLETTIDEVKRAKEDLYEKYIAARDSYKNEYEQKLSIELEQVRSKTTIEVEKLREAVKEMYQRENQSMRHAKDDALAERDKHIQLERDLQRKYDELLEQHRQYETRAETNLAKLQSEIKLKSFELDRCQLLYEENLKSLKNSLSENEKLQKKVELIQKEYSKLQIESDSRLMKIDAELNEKRTKLQVYENVERELDEVVMQAAQVENEKDANNVLFSYGYGATLPTAAKRRLEHSVHLAKRVIQLEQANTSLRSEIERERKNKSELKQQLDEANKILDQAQQPYDFLISTVRSKDVNITKQQQTIEQLDKQLRESEDERQSLIKTNNQLTKDIEKLLEYQEPLKVMKNVILNLQHNEEKLSPRRSPSPISAHRRRSLTPPRETRRRAVAFADPLDNALNNPPPTLFTSNGKSKINSNSSLHGNITSQQGKYRKIYKMTNN